MRKNLFLICVILFILTSCSNKSTPIASESKPTQPSSTESKPIETPTKKNINYIDGTYHAQETEHDDVNGYIDQITITVENSKIAKVDFNGVDKNGRDKKTESQSGGSYNMKNAGATKDWHEQAELLEQHLIETQDPESIILDDKGYCDSVAGVSIKADDFYALSMEALQNARR